jgi:hypothetical protein
MDITAYHCEKKNAPSWIKYSENVMVNREFPHMKIITHFQLFYSKLL